MQNRGIFKNIAPLDRELLLSSAANMPKEYIFAHPEHKLNKSQVALYKSYVTRRLRNEPIAYITGEKEFYGLDFEVNKNVLIPRPETELLVEKVLNFILKVQPFSSRLSQEARFPKVEPLAIIDLGTGSGNIIVSLVKNIPGKIRKKMRFFALDISEKALFMAKKNAKKHAVDKNIAFIRSDLLGYFLAKKDKGPKNLVIIANLPYVSAQIYQKYSNNLKFEPKTALLSKKSGLEHYNRLIKQIKKILFVDHCSLIIEISPEQKIALNKFILKELPLAKINFFKDLAGKTRAAKIIIKD